MKRLIAGSLACLIAVSANANNWFYIDTAKDDGVDHYMDINTLTVVDQTAQIVTAFVKMRGIEKTKLRFNNMIVSSTSFGGVLKSMLASDIAIIDIEEYQIKHLKVVIKFL